MLTWLMMIGIIALVFFVTSCTKDGPVQRYLSLGFLCLAGASLFLAGVGFAFSDPFPVTDIPVGARAAIHGGKTHHALMAVTNFFASLGRDGNALVWGALGLICLRCAWTGSWDRFAGLVRQVGR